MMAKTYQDQVLNQHHPTLDSTSHLSHPGQGGMACMGHISMMLWAWEVGEGGVLSQFLTRSVVDSVYKTPIARLGGQNPCFWLHVPNSLVNSP
jgi:hypothetical protein